MRFIDIETWPRREHFRMFNASAAPHFSVCAPLDVTAFYRAVKRGGWSFTVATVYAVTRSANAIPEFRYRIRGEAVVEHEVVHPSMTVLGRDDLFSICTMEYTGDLAGGFAAFAAGAAERMAEAREQPTMKDDTARDDLLFVTSVPWVSFTSLAFPGHLHPCQSIPNFAWGKMFAEGRRLKMPLALRAHHGLVDGVHAGRFYEHIQEFLHRPGPS